MYVLRHTRLYQHLARLDLIFVITAQHAISGAVCVYRAPRRASMSENQCALARLITFTCYMRMDSVRRNESTNRGEHQRVNCERRE